MQIILMLLLPVLTTGQLGQLAVMNTPFFDSYPNCGLHNVKFKKFRREVLFFFIFIEIIVSMYYWGSHEKLVLQPLKLSHQPPNMVLLIISKSPNNMSVK